MAGVNIYHVKRPDFSGTRLYPLNRLKDRLPGIYESAVKKYEGREWLMNVAIPTLGCLWNDVLGDGKRYQVPFLLKVSV